MPWMVCVMVHVGVGKVSVAVGEYAEARRRVK